MVVTDFIVKLLDKKGIKQVFELSGGMIMQLIDAFYQDKSIELISIHHEQTASFAADAQGRVNNGIPGVAIATSGPGATNLLTGIASCYFDSAPAIFITGQVNRHEQKGDKQIRQLGFQETDIITMVTPICKKAYRVNEANELPNIFIEAFHIINDGRPGPVVIDIPMDVFRSTIQNLNFEEYLNHFNKTDEFEVISESHFTELIEAINNASKPLILAGGGINASRSREHFSKLVDILNIPVVHSLLAVDILPTNHHLNAGFIGTYGNRWSNISLNDADLVLVLGSRLDIRQTGADTVAFKANKKIYHVDAEFFEMNNRVVNCIAIHANLKPFITQFITYLQKYNSLSLSISDWKSKIKDLQLTWPDTNEVVNKVGINPNEAMHLISNTTLNMQAYTVDVGQHQMWAAQSINIKNGQRFLTSGGMGAMGYALPAAIGVATLNKQLPVCMIAGDAGFQLNIQELQTIKRNNLPIKMVVINNNCHGMTRQFQETYFNARYRSTIEGYSTPNFVAVANAYGINGAMATTTEELVEALVEMEKNISPFLLEIAVDTFTNAYPKLAFGLPMSEMEPFAKPKEMEAT